MNVRYILGVDLGQHGGLSLLKNGEIVNTCVMPLNAEGTLNIQALRDYLSGYDSESILVVFEEITPLHLASKKANWSLALQSGALEALCIALNLKYRKILPKIWQKEMFKTLPPLRTKTGQSDTKGLALIVVKKLFPTRSFLATDRSKVPHDGIIDATLLACYVKPLIAKNN